MFINTAHAQIPSSGLVAYWPLNGNFNDAGPNSIHGTNFGATATADKLNAASNAIDFNNPTSTVNQYGTHPVNSNLNFSLAQNFSISFLFYLKSPFVHTVGFYDNNLNYAGYGAFLWLSGGSYQVVFIAGNGSISSTAVPLATWKHVVCVKDGSTLRIYIDGTQVASGPAGSTTPVYDYPARFGSMFFNGFTPPQYNGMHGALDEMRIYNRALTPTEVANISSTTLPLQLGAFTAAAAGNGVYVNWETLTEHNTSHFEIESSHDAQHFISIGRVNAKGSSATTINYSFYDGTKKDIVYYRLKMVDNDGVYSYSRVLALRAETNGIKGQLFPNPVAEVLQLQLPAQEKKEVTVSILDVSGKRLNQKNLQLQKGNNAISIPVNSLPKGLYTVRVQTANETSSFPFVKQ